MALSSAQNVPMRRAVPQSVQRQPISPHLGRTILLDSSTAASRPSPGATPGPGLVRSEERLGVSKRNEPVAVPDRAKDVPDGPWRIPHALSQCGPDLAGHVHPFRPIFELMRLWEMLDGPQRQSRSGDHITPLADGQRANVRRIPQALELVVEHAHASLWYGAVNENEAAIRRQHPGSFRNKPLSGRKMMRCDPAGHDVD